MRRLIVSLSFILLGGAAHAAAIPARITDPCTSVEQCTPVLTKLNGNVNALQSLVQNTSSSDPQYSAYATEYRNSLVDRTSYQQIRQHLQMGYTPPDIAAARPGYLADANVQVAHILKNFSLQDNSAFMAGVEASEYPALPLKFDAMSGGYVYDPSAAPAPVPVPDPTPIPTDPGSGTEPGSGGGSSGGGISSNSLKEITDQISAGNIVTAILAVAIVLASIYMTVHGVTTIIDFIWFYGINRKESYEAALREHNRNNEQPDK